MEVKFMDAEHEANYLRYLYRMRSRDVYHRCAAYLMALDIFYNVDYTGYNLVTTNEDESIWQINVVCTLAGNETAPEASDDAGEVN